MNPPAGLRFELVDSDAETATWRITANLVEFLWPTTTREDHMSTHEANIESTAVNRINQIAANLASGGDFAGVASAPHSIIDEAADLVAVEAHQRAREHLRRLEDLAAAEEQRDEARARLRSLRRGIMAAGPGAAEIAHERARQQEHEGYHPINDLHNHQPADLLEAALCYGTAAVSQLQGVTEEGVGTWRPEGVDMAVAPDGWPFGQDQWKPADDPRRNLEKAGALIAAEIDRLDLQRARDNLTTPGDDE